MVDMVTDIVDSGGNNSDTDTRLPFITAEEMLKAHENIEMKNNFYK